MPRRHAIVTASLVVALLSAPAWPAQATSGGPVIDNANLYAGGRACATSTPNYFGDGVRLQAIGSDTTRGATSFRYTFSVTPVDGSSAAKTIVALPISEGRVATASAGAGVVQDGKTYSWKVRLSDSVGTSAWSRACLFSYDTTPPGPPVVTSVNYPSDTFGPVGQPARFTLDGQGDTDVAGFEYSWTDDPPLPACALGAGSRGQDVCSDPLAQSDVVRANHPGGTASLVLNPPSAGYLRLIVRSIDRAGNVSDRAITGIYVPQSGPTINTPDEGQLLCAPRTVVTFAAAAGVPRVVSFRYSLDGGNSFRTLTPNGQGRASITVPGDSATPIEISSTSSNGFVSTPNFGYLRPGEAAATTVSSADYPAGRPAGGVGVVGSFVFGGPVDSGTSDFVWHVGSGADQRVDLTGDGSATVSFTPTAAGTQVMTVAPEFPDGEIHQCSARYTFTVAGAAPTSSAPPTSAAPTSSGATSGTPSSSMTSSGTSATAPAVAVTDSSGKSLTNGAAVRPGDDLLLSTTGFVAGSRIAVTLHSRPSALTTLVADSTGAATYRFHVPSNLVGSHRILFTSGGRSVAFGFVVSSSSSVNGGGTGLAQTGFDSQGMLFWAAALLLAGAAAAAGGRVRRRPAGRHR